MKVLRVVISPDSRWLVSSSTDGWLSLWNMDIVNEALRCKANNTIHVKHSNTSIPTPSLLCCLNASDGGIEAASNVTDKSLLEQKHGFGNICWSTNGDHLLGCAYSTIEPETSVIYIWNFIECQDGHTMNLISAVSHHDGAVGFALFVPTLLDDSEKAVLGGVNCLSLEAMKRLTMFVSVGEVDHMMLLCDAHSGTILAELSETAPFGEMGIIPPSPSRDNTDIQNFVHCAGYILYVSAEASVKMCKIELCEAAEDLNLHAEIPSSSPSYYYRIISVYAVEFPHSIMSIGYNFGRREGQGHYLILSFAENHGCALIGINVSVVR